MEEGAQAALVFPSQSAADHGGNLGGKAVACLRPFAVFQAGHHAPGDLFLGIPRVHTPDPIGAFNRDLIVDDIYPDGFVCRSFNHNAIPACEFELGREAAAEVAVAKPFNRIQHGSQPLNFAPSGARHEGSGKRIGHHDYQIAGVECIKRKLFADQIKEDGGTHSMASAVFLILFRGNSIDRSIGQVHPEYLSRISARHYHAS